MREKVKRIPPAEHVIAVCGGTTKTASLFGFLATNVSAWKKAKERGGYGGQIPRSKQQVILLKAKELGLDITAEDLILGREED